LALEGEMVLVTDAGQLIVRAGDLAASNRDDADHGEYPDLDLVFTGGRYTGTGRYLHRDGTPY
jgi:uncharacterized cupin superfamily protein